MKPSSHSNALRHFQRVTKYLLLAAMAAVLAIPQAEAKSHRHRYEERRVYSHERRVYSHHPVRRIHARPAPVVVRRTWVRPGFYGAYPPVGYVNYRYVHALPSGYRVVYRHGHRFYFVNGGYYWPARYHNRGVFISVNF